MIREVRCALLLLSALALDARAAIYTVGPGGTHTTIQSAIDAALAHPGDDEVRVHTGVYNESLTVSGMTTSKLVIRGGYGDGYAVQVRNGAANTIVSPLGAGRLGAELLASGGTLVVSNLNFYGAQTASFAAGVYVSASGSAVMSLDGLLLTENVIATDNFMAAGAGINIAAAGNAQVTVSDSRFQRNRASVLSGAGAALGAGVYADCKEAAICGVLGNTFDDQTVEARGAAAIGGAAYVRVRDYATAVVNDNRITLVRGSTRATVHRGRSLAIEAMSHAAFAARRNRIEAAAPLAGIGAEEVFLHLLDQSTGTFGDGLIAQSPFDGLTADVQTQASVSLVNLTVADNHRGVNVLSMSTKSSYVSNCLITNVAAENTFQGSIFANNRQGPGAPFRAPAQYDYSLTSAAPLWVDAGTDAPNGGLGTTDIDGAPRKQGAHVDIGAWEFRKP